MKWISVFSVLLVGLALAPAPALSDETGLASSHDLGMEGGRLCMSNHGHSGSAAGSTKASARAGAIRSWAEFTNFEYGSAWASYSAAAAQSTHYTKEASGWSATVEARPCKR